MAAGSVLFHASAFASEGKRPWRATAAPSGGAEVVALADYILQLPGNGTPEIGGEINFDTLRERDIPGGLSYPDSVKRQGAGNPDFADTLAPGTPGGQFHGAQPAATPRGVRRGILGIHPLALLVGLIALHIFVVTVAGK